MKFLPQSGSVPSVSDSRNFLVPKKIHRRFFAGLLLGNSCARYPSTSPDIRRSPSASQYSSTINGSYSHFRRVDFPFPFLANDYSFVAIIEYAGKVT